jgi:hypothetical protein
MAASSMAASSMAASPAPARPTPGPSPRSATATARTAPIVGGAGVPLYLAGLLLVPDEGSDQSIAASIIESLQNRNR